MTERESLAAELYQTNRDIEEERRRFSVLRDDDLLDETIYRLMALSRRQEYLIKQIKELDKDGAGRG